ncbi:hypothetical protein [Planctopirus ephydatiae]|uniref:hypothetical protein n=1 Tax=Planctopirus ephydatiae TaxID=2528019 RepID=UPI00119E70D6|nr:hypothetical protein [Planctopirus ephydatiae]
MAALTESIASSASRRPGRVVPVRADADRPCSALEGGGLLPALRPAPEVDFLSAFFGLVPRGGCFEPESLRDALTQGSAASSSLEKGSSSVGFFADR